MVVHDFKANIKVVLTTLMTWQTFQGEMREREKERKKEQKVIFSNRATDSIISVEITDQHWALLLQLQCLQRSKVIPKCGLDARYIQFRKLFSRLEQIGTMVSLIYFRTL